MSVRGTMTLEAAIIMPIVLVLMMLSIQYAVYMHDTTACQAFLDTYEMEGDYKIEKMTSLIQGNGYVSIDMDEGVRLSYIANYFGTAMQIEVYKKPTPLDTADWITQIDFIDDLMDEKWYNKDR